jgi:ABC-type multidrug transport system fused ATPase/permease subunit
LPEDAYKIFPNARGSKAFNRFVGINSVYSDPFKVEEATIVDQNELNTATTKASHLEFRNVDFSYDRAAVLSNLSLSIDEKEIVAIVGSSGSGKSTLSALATRLYDPSSGQVLFEGRNVKHIPDLRQRISVVDQDHHLLHGSILENLRYSNQNASLPEIEEALNIACAYEFVISKGLHLQVGTGVLSGGQRQRLAVARAIVKILTVPSCRMLFLDEGLSNLDRNTAEKTWENICMLSKRRGLTVVHVTHQQVSDLVGTVDKVIRLDHGKVTEQRFGTRLSAR